MPKQTVRTGPSDDDQWDTEVDFEDQFQLKGAGSNTLQLNVSPGVFYLGPTKYLYPGGSITCLLYTSPSPRD